MGVRMLVLGLRERRLLLQLLDALLNVVGGIGIDFALELGVDGLAELAAKLQLLLLHRVQQLLLLLLLLGLVGSRVQRVVLLVVGLGVARHLVVHSAARPPWQATGYISAVSTASSVRVATRAVAAPLAPGKVLTF